MTAVLATLHTAAHWPLPSAAVGKKRKKTTPFGVNSMRSPVSYQATHVLQLYLLQLCLLLDYPHNISCSMHSCQTLLKTLKSCLNWNLTIAVHSFQDGQEQSLGPEDFMTMLHETGANQRLATEAWVSNCYCWILWKLAAYEQTYSEQLQGKLLTKDVVLDQLKYRSVAASSAWHEMFEHHQTWVERCCLCTHSSLLVVGY